MSNHHDIDIGGTSRGTHTGANMKAKRIAWSLLYSFVTAITFAANPAFSADFNIDLVKILEYSVGSAYSTNEDDYSECNGNGIFSGNRWLNVAWDENQSSVDNIMPYTTAQKWLKTGFSDFTNGPNSATTFLPGGSNVTLTFTSDWGNCSAVGSQEKNLNARWTVRIDYNNYDSKLMEADHGTNPGRYVMLWGDTTNSQVSVSGYTKGDSPADTTNMYLKTKFRKKLDGSCSNRYQARGYCDPTAIPLSGEYEMPLSGDGLNLRLSMDIQADTGICSSGCINIINNYPLSSDPAGAIKNGAALSDISINYRLYIEEACTIGFDDSVMGSETDMISKAAFSSGQTYTIGTNRLSVYCNIESGQPGPMITYSSNYDYASVNPNRFTFALLMDGGQYLPGPLNKIAATANLSQANAKYPSCKNNTVIYASGIPVAYPEDPICSSDVTITTPGDKDFSQDNPLVEPAIYRATITASADWTISAPNW